MVPLEVLLGLVKPPIYPSVTCVRVLGICAVAKNSCRKSYRRGQEIATMIMWSGGLQSHSAFPHTAKLILKTASALSNLRYNRVRHLSPCFSFGENDMGSIIQPKGSFARWWSPVQKYMSFAPPFFGRGVVAFWRDLPAVSTAVIVVRKTNRCPQNWEPSIEEIPNVS
jgi:2-acylglycerol O-acyltransferase 2